MICLFFALLTPHAREPVPPSSEEIAAEARRLSEEISKASKRAAWPGVERHYARALALGTPLSASVHMTAAESARAAGDLSLARERLIRVLALEPQHPSALQQILFLDRTYGRVVLKGKPGSVLEDYERPFDPMMLKTVDLAIERMREQGSYSGLLPPGPYALDADPFEIKAGVEFVLDLSPPPIPESTSPKAPWKR